MRRIMTPYRIKVVEPIKWNTKEERENIIKEADYCTGFLKAEDIPINFETDSGWDFSYEPGSMGWNDERR